jgi:ribonucleoside-diphosphate reductase alpha chain
LESQIETGVPYMLFKDTSNRKSNQSNLGTIRCSNLCAEIIQYTNSNEIAVCNLSSISLPSMVKTNKKGQLYFDHDFLYEIAYTIAINLNRVIDVNFHPLPESKTSNMKNRAIGIGCQGLADVFILLRLSWESEKAFILNREIFETIYFAAMNASVDLAIKEGPYPSYEGSPISKGLFQFDLWEIEAKEKFEKRKKIALNSKQTFDEIYTSPVILSGKWSWEDLRKKILKHGVRNSLVTALMPTASTSQILGNTECFEPMTSNIYSRRVISGEFTVVNKYLISDLMEIGLWNENIKNKIIQAGGSIQGIIEIPADLKPIYKTVWEISMRTLIDMSASRGIFIDQSQSFNCFMENPTFPKLSSMHFHAWKKGLKTGMYYLRTRPAADPIKFTVDNESLKDDKIFHIIENGDVCSRGGGCDSCGA